ncbi:MAG: hypothetical protein ACO23R_16275, partial [bacterium]
MNNEMPQSEASQEVAAPQAQETTSTAFSPESLPEDLRNEPSLRNFDDVGKLAKSYVHLVKKMGVPAEQLVRLPSSPDGNWDEVYNQLGRPADPSGYELDLSNDLNREYAEGAHKLGLTKEQARQVYSWMNNKYNQLQQDSKQQYREQTMQGLADLKREWGQDFESQAGIARQAFLQLADADMVQAMEETGLGNSPQMIKLFNRVGQILQEDGLLQNDIAFGDSGGRASI